MRNFSTRRLFHWNMLAKTCQSLSLATPHRLLPLPVALSSFICFVRLILLFLYLVPITEWVPPDTVRPGAFFEVLRVSFDAVVR